jgi:hypothetical protein
MMSIADICYTLSFRSQPRATGEKRKRHFVLLSSNNAIQHLSIKTSVTPKHLGSAKTAPDVDIVPVALDQTRKECRGVGRDRIEG